jgi:hypothetical protein
LFCFKFFSHGNSIGKISQKFTDENIPSVFLFVFINFLAVTGRKLRSKKIATLLERSS